MEGPDATNALARPPGGAGIRRPSVVALAALLAGMGTALAAGNGAAWPGLVLGAAAVAAGIAAFRAARPEGLRVAALVAGAFAMGWLLQAPRNAAEAQSRAAIAAIERAAGGPVRIEGRVASEPRLGRHRATVVVAPGARIERVGAPPARLSAPLVVSLPLPEGDSAEVAGLARGDFLAAHGMLRPGADAPGPGDLDAWLASLGAVASVRARGWTSEPPPGGRRLVDQWRHAARRAGDAAEDRLRAGMPEGPAAIACAMVLGRTRWLSTEQRDATRRAGLLHLFAVSGLHAGIIAGLVALLAAMFGLGPWPRAVAIAIALVVFASVTGFRSSVLRAGLLVGVFLCQPLLRRSVDPAAALSSIALVLILLRPRSPWQIDFQLSFLCAFAIAVAGPGAIAIEEWMGRAARFRWWTAPVKRCLQVAFVTACIQLATAPLLSSTFGSLSIISPLANIPALALAPFVLAGSLLGLAGAWAFGTDALMWLGAAPAMALESTARAMAWPRWAAADALPRWSPWWTALYFAALAAGLGLGARASFRPHRIATASYLRGALAAGAVFAWQSAALGAGPLLRVDFIDVGQGDATLVRARGGAAMLVDAGPLHGGRALVESLRGLGVERIDLLVLTHADADHIGGAAEVMRAFAPAQIAGAHIEAPTGIFAAVEAARRQLGLPRLDIARGDSFLLGPGVQVDVLHPSPEFTTPWGDRNESSVVLMVRAGAVSFLLTGDAEERAEADLVASFAPDELRAAVLKAGHHGSSTSTTMPLLAAVRPAHAVISCGRGNRYGHPAPSVLARLDEWGARAWRTDLHGTISFETDGRELRARAARSGAAAEPAAAR